MNNINGITMQEYKLFENILIKCNNIQIYKLHERFNQELHKREQQNKKITSYFKEVI